MAEISNNVRKQLLAGDVTPLTKNGGLSCVTTQIKPSDDPKQDTTKIKCEEHRATYSLPKRIRPDVPRQGLFYIYYRTDYGQGHNHSRTSLKWAGVVKVREHLYEVVINDDNLNGKIDSPDSDAKLTETNTVSSSIPQVGYYEIPFVSLRTEYSEGSPTPEIPFPMAEILKDAEAQYQSALRAAGLLSK